MSAFSSFRKQNNDINNLREKFNKLNGGGGNNNSLDDTYWTTKHIAGPDGKGEAIIRFLPAPPDGNGGQEPDNIVKYFKYAINRNGKWYINRGRNSLGANEPDPANDYNRKIWSDKSLTKEQKKAKLVDRSENYVANIRVIKDPNMPEAEGKTFRFEFGRMIYNMINAQLFPEFETDKPVNVFDPEEGADFVFRVTQKTIPDKNTGEMRKVPTYENSKFNAPSKRWDVESGEFDEIWNSEYSLQSEVAESKYKPYEELVKEFNRVMGYDQSAESSEPTKTQKTEKSTTYNNKKAVVDDEIPFDKFDSKEETKSNDDSPPWDTEDQKEDSSSGDNSSASEEIDDWFASLGK